MEPFPPHLVVFNELAIRLISSFTLADALTEALLAKYCLSGTPCV